MRMRAGVSEYARVCPRASVLSVYGGSVCLSASLSLHGLPTRSSTSSHLSASACARHMRLRFLRKFDMTSRDPATSGRCLQSFCTVLQKLFVDGYIMCDAGSSIPELGPLKTITQIAMEQLSDFVEIRYGKKVKVLWSNVSRNDCEEALAEMRSIVSDVVARLQADFHENDLYMCLGALDLAEWQEAMGDSMPTTSVVGGEAGAGVDKSAVKLALLRRKAKRLCEALGAPFSFESWKKAVGVALETPPAPSPAASSDSADLLPDNRPTWSRVMAESAVLGETGLLPVVQFYLSLSDGTGDVERGLGTHADFLKHHEGAREGEVSMAEVCLEIVSEGPSSEGELFEVGPCGELLLTEFSRECANLWLAQYGRRFTCSSKPRKDAGTTRTGWRLRGSIKAAGLLQHRATDALVQHAVSDEAAADEGRGRQTIVGIRREKLMRRVSQRATPTPTKALLTFRKVTADRLQIKSQSTPWPGYGPTPPKLRPRPGHAPSGAGAVALSASRWLQRRTSGTPHGGARQDLKRPLAVVAGDSDGTPCKYKKVISVGDVENAKFVVVGDHDDLVRKDASPELLSSWLGVIAFGKAVRCSNGKAGVRQYAPALTSATAAVNFSERFERKHPYMVKSWRQVASRPASKWTEDCVEGKKKKGVMQVDDLEDYRKMLLSLRRFPNLAAVQCQVGATPKEGMSALSRYGNAVRRPSRFS